MSRKNLATLATNVSVTDMTISPVYLSARSAIVAPERAIVVTQYSLKKWLPRLGADRWSLVQLLRGLSIDAPRRPDGTKQVTISWRYLAECLQVHEETVASWLKHEVIPGDKPWRRIIPVDDYAEHLSLFIPRLRYAYETRKRKTRRVGFLLEVLMEDPVAPEDEIKLAQQVEYLQMQQGELGLDTYRIRENVNRTRRDLLDLPAQAISPVSASNSNSHQTHHSGVTELTVNEVNRDYPDSVVSVKQPEFVLHKRVSGESSSLPTGKSDEIANNVNKLKEIINHIIKLKAQKRNYQQLLEPVIAQTEDLLEDYHSTAMLHKVLRVLFPDHMDVYVQAVEDALVASAIERAVNKGAMFVKALQALSAAGGIDLGFRRVDTRNRSSQQTLVYAGETDASVPDVFQTSLEEVVWAEALEVLQGQMTRATFNSVMQGTQLLGLRDEVYVVQVATAIARDWLDNRLKPVVERALSTVIGTSVRVEFQV